MVSYPFHDQREIAPMLAVVWGPLAPTVASLIAARPDLGRRLSLAPPWVIHATAAYIEAVRDEGRPEDEIAVDVAERHVRDLLATAVPEPHEQLATTLKRVGDRVVDLAFYRRLNAVLCGPGAPVVLEAELVHHRVLQVAEWVAADPVMLAARHAIGTSERDARSLRCILRYLRQTGLAKDIQALPSNTMWRGIMRRLTADLGRTRTAALPFRLPPGWRAVETLADLWAVGRRMNNCMADLRMSDDYDIHNAVRGTHTFITTIDKPLALATIQRVGETSWTISEIEVQGNEYRNFRENLMTALSDAAAEVGQTFYDACPLSAIRSLACRHNRSKQDLGDDDLDDVA